MQEHVHFVQQYLRGGFDNHGSCTCLSDRSARIASHDTYNEFRRVGRLRVTWKEIPFTARLLLFFYRSEVNDLAKWQPLTGHEVSLSHLYNSDCSKSSTRA